MPTTVGNTTSNSLSVKEQTMHRKVKWPAVLTTSKGRRFIVDVMEAFSLPDDEEIVEIDGVAYAASRTQGGETR